MNATINSENETEFHFVLNVINEIRAASKRPDNQAILDHINETLATNMDGNHIDEILSSLLEKELIYIYIYHTIKGRYVILHNGTNE